MNDVLCNLIFSFIFFFSMFSLPFLFLLHLNNTLDSPTLTNRSSPGEPKDLN